LSERTKDGLISNIDFRNAFKQLNLGITTKEIDELLSYCDINKDGFIDWKEFEKKFNIRLINYLLI
jgi:Ca2+-binding EF-hand superfamily protein